MQPTPSIPLAKSWPAVVGRALLHALCLARFVAIHTRSWAANSRNERVRLKAEVDRLHSEVLLLQEELRIKNARMERIPPKRRPHYPPCERMAILQLRALRGWSQQRTASVFQITSATIAAWCRRLDQQGADALVRWCEPVNRFPDFVRELVRTLKLLSPQWGKKRIAQVLGRAGLHLGVSTVGRILKESPGQRPKAETSAELRHHTATHPHRVWHVDLTGVPTGAGFWTSWLPWALPQCWPFCWWVAVVIDGYSRMALGFAVFDDKPSSVAVRAFLGRTIQRVGTAPKDLICDQGSQFACPGFRRWARRRGIDWRYGAIGRHGSLAVIERLIGTLKREGLRRLLVPLRRMTFQRELALILQWYNADRPHSAWDGATPNEVYHGLSPANRSPRIEPRARWPRSSPCAAPQTLIAGQPGDRCQLQIAFLAGRRHLPVVTLKRAA